MIAHKERKISPVGELIVSLLISLLLSGCGASPRPESDSLETQDYQLYRVKYIAMDQYAIAVETAEGKDVDYSIVIGRTRFFDYWCNPVLMGDLIRILRIGSPVIIGVEEDGSVMLAIKPGDELRAEDSEKRICSRK